MLQGFDTVDSSERHGKTHVDIATAIQEMKAYNAARRNGRFPVIPHVLHSSLEMAT